MKILNSVDGFLRPHFFPKENSFVAHKAILLLCLLSIFSCILFAVRAIITDDLYYGFLVWNLFLAWLPLLFSLRALNNQMTGRKKWRLLLPSLMWFIFFPNAPYIITDLVHLKSFDPVPMWYDSLLVFSFATTGLLVGMGSLLIMHRIIQQMFGTLSGWSLMFVIFVASGFGIYVGRILRWNSWDLFVNTIPLFSDLSEHAMTKTSLAITSTFSAFIAIAYLLIYSVIHFPGEKKLRPHH